jgi:glucosylceramidase
VGGYLGEALEGSGVDIIFGTINGPETDGRMLYTRYSDYLGVAMLDEGARSYIKAVAYQWAGKYALIDTHDDYPDLEIIQSESECGRGENSWEHMMYIFEMMRLYFRMGASSYVYWNIALEGDSFSTWGWPQNSLIHVKDGIPSFTPEFYLMKHFSHFVKRGARYLMLKGEFSSSCIAFRNPDGKTVLIAANPYHKEITVTLEGKSYVLPPRSITQ